MRYDDHLSSDYWWHGHVVPRCLTWHVSKISFCCSSGPEYAYQRSDPEICLMLIPCTESNRAWSCSPFPCPSPLWTVPSFAGPQLLSLKEIQYSHRILCWAARRQDVGHPMTAQHSLASHGLCGKKESQLWASSPHQNSLLYLWVRHTCPCSFR